MMIHPEMAVSNNNTNSNAPPINKEEYAILPSKRNNSNSDVSVRRTTRDIKVTIRCNYMVDERKINGTLLDNNDDEDVITRPGASDEKKVVMIRPEMAVSNNAPPILFMDVYKVGCTGRVALGFNFGGFVSFLAGLFGFILAGTAIRRNSYMMDNFGRRFCASHTQTDGHTDTQTHSSSLSLLKGGQKREESTVTVFFTSLIYSSRILIWSDD